MSRSLRVFLVMAGATVVLASQPALSASSTSSSSAASRSSAVRSAAPAARTAAPSVTAPTSPAPGPTTLTSPGTSTTTTGPGTAVVTTSPSNTSTPMTGTGGGGARTPNLSTFNPGAQDQNAPADPNQVRAPAGAPGSPTTAAGTPTPTPGDQILGTNGVQLPNVGQTTNGAVPGQVTTNRGEVNASSGGTARPDPGATGRNMTECMSAWDSKTHIAKPRWREICARTLTEPHV